MGAANIHIETEPPSELTIDMHIGDRFASSHFAIAIQTPHSETGVVVQSDRFSTHISLMSNMPLTEETGFADVYVPTATISGGYLTVTATHITPDQ